ncbi:MAG: GNAT family N-acetyltransferase [Verrucomicrobiota bacterium]
MTIRPVSDCDLSLIATWNQQFQEEARVAVMGLDAIEARFRRWFTEGYEAVLFEASRPVGYSLHRECGSDWEGPGYYIRQYFIDRKCRRQGHGRTAFACLQRSVFADRRVILDVLESNPGGLAFWASLGMTPYSHKLEIHP